MSVLQVSNIWFESTGTKRIGLEGGSTVRITTDLTTSGNVYASYFNGDGSNVTNLVAAADISAPFSQANTAFLQANNAYAQANLVFGVGNSAFGQANQSFIQSNLVFDAANASFAIANGYGANITFANTVARLAYDNANTIGIAFGATNAAYGRTNTINIIAQNSFNTANFENRAAFAFGVVNTAFGRTNTIYLIANNASNTANFENRAVAAFGSSNIVFNAANASFGQANIAIANVNYVNTATVAAFANTNAAYTVAVSAFAQANLGSNVTTILSNVSVGTGTSFVVNSTNINQPFRLLEMWLRAVGHNNASNTGLFVTISTNNGTTTSGPTQMGFSINSADAWWMKLEIDNADLTTTGAYRLLFTTGGYGTGATVYAWATSVAATGYINYISIAPGAGNFDTGTVTLYGWQ